MPPPLASAPNINHLWAGLLVEELVRQGTTFFVVCPGSRSTPLAVAVGQNPRAEALVHWDERAAAFVALGWGRATGRPAAVVTTSGTAVANLLPAAVEADADGVPLLLITADRPSELRETGANQTVRQPPVFQDVARWSLDWPVPTADVPARWVLSTAAHAAHRATAPPGPVHLNLPFREPLGGEADGTDAAAYLGGVGAWIEVELSADETYSNDDISTGLVRRVFDEDGHLTRVLKSPPFVSLVGGRRSGLSQDGDGGIGLPPSFWEVERGVIILGDLMGGGGFAHRLDFLDAAKALGWPILPSIRAPFRYAAASPDGEPVFVTNVDLVLTGEEFRERRRPDAVLHLGGRIVSKRLAQFLAASQPSLYVQASESPARLDPDGIVTHVVRSPMQGVVKTLLREAAQTPSRRADGAWPRAWRKASEAVEGVVVNHLDELSEPAVARALARPGTTVFAAASMPIRDLEAYAPTEGYALTTVVANRGASGIDGTLASAVGYGRGAGQRPTVLIGDLALLHDLTSLALLRDGPAGIVVVVNNDGGGIFHRLPIAGGAGALDGDTFERFFGTPHGLTFEHAAEQFGLRYAAPQTLSEFQAVLKETTEGFLLDENSTSILIEVRTDREEQAALRRRIEAEVAEAVDAVGPPWYPLLPPAP